MIYVSITTPQLFSLLSIPFSVPCSRFSALLALLPAVGLFICPLPLLQILTPLLSPTYTPL